MVPIYGRERFYEVEKFAESGESMPFAGGHYVIVGIKYDARTQTGSFEVQQIKYPDVVIADPAASVLTDNGMALDAIGALDGVKLPRGDIEPDCDYRERLSARVHGDDLPRATALRDAIRANS